MRAPVALAILVILGAGAPAGAQSGEKVDAQLLLDLDLLRDTDVTGDRDLLRRMGVVERMRMLELLRVLDSAPADQGPRPADRPDQKGVK